MKLIMLSLAAACALADGMGSSSLTIQSSGAEESGENYSMGGAPLLQIGEQKIAECGSQGCETASVISQGSGNVQEIVSGGGQVSVLSSGVEGGSQETYSSSISGSELSQSSGSEVLAIPKIDAGSETNTIHIRSLPYERTAVSTVQSGSSSQGSSSEGSSIQSSSIQGQSSQSFSSSSESGSSLVKESSVESSGEDVKPHILISPRVISSVQSGSKGGSKQVLVKSAVQEQSQGRTCGTAVPQAEESVEQQVEQNGVKVKKTKVRPVKTKKSVQSAEEVSQKRTCGTPVPTKEKEVVVTTKPLLIKEHQQVKPVKKPLVIARPHHSSTQSSTSQVTTQVVSHPVSQPHTQVSHKSETVTNHQVTTTAHPVVHAEPESSKKTTTTTTVESVVEHPPVRPPPQTHTSENVETTVTTTTTRVPIMSKPKPKPKPKVTEEQTIEEYYVTVDANGNEERLVGKPQLIGGNTYNPNSRPVRPKVGSASPSSGRYTNMRYVDESNIQVNSELFEGQYLPVMYSLKTHKLWPYSFKFASKPIELPRTHLAYAPSGNPLNQLNIKNSKSVKQVQQLLEEEKSVENSRALNMKRKKPIKRGSEVTSSSKTTSSSVSESRPSGGNKEVSFETIIIDGDSEEQERVVSKVVGGKQKVVGVRSEEQEVGGSKQHQVVKGNGHSENSESVVTEVVKGVAHQGGKGKHLSQSHQSGKVVKESGHGGSSQVLETIITSSDGNSAKISRHEGGEGVRVVSSGHDSGSSKTVSHSSSGHFGSPFGAGSMGGGMTHGMGGSIGGSMAGTRTKISSNSGASRGGMSRSSMSGGQSDCGSGC